MQQEQEDQIILEAEQEFSEKGNTIYGEFDFIINRYIFDLL